MINKAKTMDRYNLINEVTATNKNTIAYVSTFNPRNTEIFEDLQRNIDILMRDNLTAKRPRKLQTRGPRWPWIGHLSF